MEVGARRVVPDARREIAAAVREAMREHPLVLVTGGIGPTRDDVTREAVADAIEVPLREDAASVRRLRGWCLRHRVPFSPAQRRQALLPRGARAVPNPVGSAPGILHLRGRETLLVLPGVLGELRAMLDPLLPVLRRRHGEPLATAILRCAGIGESRVDSRIAPAARRHPRVEVTTLAAPGEVTIQLRARGRRAGREIAACRAGMARALGPDLVSASGLRLEEVVVRGLAGRRWRLAVAESCTAGHVAARLTSVPGSSRVFAGGAVCYDDALKTRWLAVPREVLRRSGAVSRAAAAAMARGALALTGADLAVAITGIAGPGGGSARKPVGTIRWALAGGGRLLVAGRRLAGDREKIRRHAAAIALDLVRRFLAGRRPGRRG